MTDSGGKFSMTAFLIIWPGLYSTREDFRAGSIVGEGQVKPLTSLGDRMAAVSCI